MKKNSWYILALLLVTSVATAFSQSRIGITGKPDSSYNSRVAYEQTIKTHPDIKLVKEFIFKNVMENKNITYRKIGSRELKLDAFQPKEKSAAPRVAVLIIHGGGWRSGNRTQHYPLAQKLANLGYVCFTPEYRLSTEAFFPAAIYDIKEAIRWVRKNATTYHVDPSKVVAMGFSAGGELSAFMGTTGDMPLFEGVEFTDVSSKVAAVVDIDGTLSFIHPDASEGDDSKRISAATYWFGYPKKDNIKLWEAASPLSYVGKATPPTLFLNSAVAPMHAGREDYIKVLNDHHIYSEVHEFKGATHSFPLFDPWFEPTVKYIDDFLTKVFAEKK